MVEQKKENPESVRLDENTGHKVFWKMWGPYLSERQWGTVREDYSETGSAWDYFPFDHSRFRAYRWGEDGIAGISDYLQRLCFALALWNHKDLILKERLFGLNGKEGNHGEDVKELYYYLDNTPTHSYMKYLYKYPQCKFPYKELITKNENASKQDPEYEILDTDSFENSKYFDVFVEYAKQAPEDIYIRITAYNRGQKTAPLTLLPTLWFRNLWTWDPENQGKRPAIKTDAKNGNHVLKAFHPTLGTYYLYFKNHDSVLFTGNETNYERLYSYPNSSPYTKDAFHDVIAGGKSGLLKNKKSGTRAGIKYVLTLKENMKKSIILRLTRGRVADDPFKKADNVFKTRMKEADLFYKDFIPPKADENDILIQRQAFAGLLWNKQFYNYEIETWLSGDKNHPVPPENRKTGRNSDWLHLFNRDIISMPDKWEYPWYATWDLAFHCIPFAMIDPDFAKKQLLLFLREWYMHPNGQLPAYEWALGDVNPPVHAWACYKVFQMEKKATGKGDYSFLKRAFHKLLLNFTWWVNKKDMDGNNIFQGGFLGLDNIGIFNRSKPLPTGGYMEQADGTSWMAMYSLNMMIIALELARKDHTYEDVAAKFFEHFAHIAEAFNDFGKRHHYELWDSEDGFFYDVIHFIGGTTLSMKIRSLVGLLPLCAVTVLDASILDQFSYFTKRLKWFRNNRKSLNKQLIIEKLENTEYILFSLVKKTRLTRLLQRMFDEEEFLSPGGIRSLSKYHQHNPFMLHHGDTTYYIDYQPGEATSYLYGGNSNWRGPIWMPINYLMIEALLTYDIYFKNSLTMEFPTGSGNCYSLKEIAFFLAKRLISIFKPDKNNNRPVHGSSPYYRDQKEFKDLILFYEFFHGDTSKGLGASHQTGWTALIAKLIHDFSG